MSNNLPRQRPGRFLCQFKWNRTIHLNLTISFGMHIIVTRSEIPAIHSNKSSDCRTGVAVCVFKAGGWDARTTNHATTARLGRCARNCRAFVMPLNRRSCCRCFDEDVERFFSSVCFWSWTVSETITENSNQVRWVTPSYRLLSTISNSIIN